MGDILLFASQRAWDRIPGTLLRRISKPDDSAGALSLRPGAHLPPRLALELVGKHGGASRILVADLRCAAALSLLREHGYVAERAGNRVYGRDATPQEAVALTGYTLPEQLVSELDEDGADALTPDEQAREAWQRDGWAGLSAAGVSGREALALADVQPHASVIDADHPRVTCRELDDLTVAVVDAEPRQATAAFDAAELLRILEPPTRGTPADIGRRWGASCPANADPTDYEQARCARQPVRLRPVLLLHQRNGNTGSAHTCAIEYLGGRGHLPWLARFLDDPGLAGSFELCLTLGRYRTRLRAQPRAGTSAARVDALVSRLLEGALVTGRPLREFSCTFYLPLDLHLDEELPQPGQGRPASLIPQAPLRRHTVADSETAAKRLKKVIEAAEDTSTDLACRLSRFRFGAGDRVISSPETITGEQLAEAQALLYFLPELQDRIFDTAHVPGEDEPVPAAEPGGIRHWCLPKEALEGAELAVTLPADPRARQCSAVDAVTAAVQDISLFGYPNHLFVLAMRVGFDDGTAKQARCFAGTGDDWWHALFGWKLDPGAGWGALDGDDGTCGSPDPRPLQIERWLAFTKSARLLRAAFAQQGIENKIQTVTLRLGSQEWRSDAEPFSPVLHLLTTLTGWRFTDAADRHRLINIRDDRMVVNVAYALAGLPPSADPAARDALQRLFSLALFVDRATDGSASQGGYAYDRDFVQTQLAGCVNRRWEGLGSLYGSTNYSQVALGFGDYFAGPVARMHVPHIHGRLLLLVLLHDLTLTWFDRCITQITRDLGGIDASAPAGQARLRETGEQITAFQQRLIRFTNDHWFRTVTSQTQGIETHRLMARAFGLDDRYHLVKDKIERTHDTIAQIRDRVLAEASHRQTQLGNALGRWGPPLALAALLIGVLAIPAHRQVPSGAEVKAGFLPWLRTLDPTPLLQANWNFLAAFAVLAIAVAVWLRKRPKD